MRVTKHEHACLIVETAGSSLIVDPGSFTTPLVGTDNVVAIVITHEHADHWTPEQLQRVVDRNPSARILGPEGFASAASDFPIETVNEGDTIEIDPFTLRFFGGTHAEIHRSIPLVDNLGVLINDELYYPGDSFTVPDGVQVGTLATPAGAPWLKIGEVMDFVEAVKPRRSFPTHEMVLSAAGKALSNARIKDATEAVGGEFFSLEPGESIDL